MISVFLFIFAFIFTVGHIAYNKSWALESSAAIFLRYLFLFSVGIMGILAAYAHIFMGPELARLIGWQPGSPFQFEVAMANLSYGILGVLAYWIRGRFWNAVAIGWSIYLLGCFVGHMINYYTTGNHALLNAGIFVWFNDLFLPVLVLGLLYYIRKQGYSSIE